jgi:hypothetical protein
MLIVLSSSVLAWVTSRWFDTDPHILVLNLGNAKGGVAEVASLGRHLIVEEHEEGFVHEDEVFLSPVPHPDRQARTGE